MSKHNQNRPWCCLVFNDGKLFICLIAERCWTVNSETDTERCRPVFKAVYKISERTHAVAGRTDPVELTDHHLTACTYRGTADSTTWRRINGFVLDETTEVVRSKAEFNSTKSPGPSSGPSPPLPVRRETVDGRSIISTRMILRHGSARTMSSNRGSRL